MGEMCSHRRLPRPAPPLENDDLLREILLRLPPLPSSLPRASAVCKRWRSLASDPAFSLRFRRHHRSSTPLLGFFKAGSGSGQLSFEPTLEAPNRVPRGRFSLQLDNKIRFFGCRHGLALIFFDYKPLQLLVWDPVTGQQHHLAVPPRFDPAKAMVNGAVLRCSAGDVEHFQVVLAVAENKDRSNSRLLACVYSSETGEWGNLTTTPIPSREFLEIYTDPAVLVGSSLYWELDGVSLNILEFDLEWESLSVIPMPDDVIHLAYMRDAEVTVMPAEGGGLGLLCVWGFIAQLWKWNTDVGSWGMGTTIGLDKLLSLDSDSEDYPQLHGFAEDNNLVLLRDGVSLFTVQFESLQFKKLTKPEMMDCCHPFESVYAAGSASVAKTGKFIVS